MHRPGMMRWGVLGAALALSVGLAHAYSDNTVSKKFAPGGRVRLHLQSGGYDLVGTDAGEVVVRYSAPSDEELKRVRVQINTSDSTAEISVRDTPNSNFHATIEIPRRSDLWARLTAGELKISGVEGEKDVEANAGDLEIIIARPEDYGHRDASVTAGGLDASAFHVSKGGLFRSFQQEGPGKYRLHAHLTAGNLVLRTGS